MRELFSNTISEFDSATKYANECYKFGMTWGCQLDCPVFKLGDCQDVYIENIEQFMVGLDEDEFLDLLLTYQTKLTSVEADGLLNKYFLKAGIGNTDVR